MNTVHVLQITHSKCCVMRMVKLALSAIQANGISPKYPQKLARTATTLVRLNKIFTQVLTRNRNKPP